MRFVPVSLLAGLMLAGCGAPDDSVPPATPQTERVATSAPTPSPAAAIEPTVKMGEMLFRRCVACHTIEAGGANGIGPNLHNVVNRPIGSDPDFIYSNAMKNKGGAWDEAMLDHFLTQPMMAIPGSRMAFAGVIEPSDRKALYLYLKENSPNVQ